MSKSRRRLGIWKLRLMGFTCGLGMFLSLVVAAQVPESFGEHELLLWVMFPLIGVLLALLGWFLRIAYISITRQLHHQDECMDSLRETVIRMCSNLEPLMKEIGDHESGVRGRLHKQSNDILKLDGRVSELERERK